MENKLITVVVPCYNNEKYLPKCIESILNQTYSNLEIILVNDGSTDNSIAVINEYAKKDKRIVVIDQKNQGVSVARNTAIDIAKGEYLSFVDSDDIISLDYFEVLMDSLTRNDADIAICRALRFVEGEEIVKPAEEYNEEVFNREEVIENLIVKGDFYDFPSTKLYKKVLFENERYAEGRVYEDSSIIFKLYEKCKKVVVNNQKNYFYLVAKPTSITGSSYTLKKQKDNLSMLTERYEYLMDKMPHMKDLITAGCIRNMLTLLERSYLSKDQEVINTEIVAKVKSDIKEMAEVVDKNVLFKVLNKYRLAALTLLMHNEELYVESIEKLCK